MSCRRSPLRFAFALALCALVAYARAESSAPRRIASLNLCTDQLLLMLVPRARIASLTDWAARPESSYMAQAAIGIPANHALAEAVLPQQPDLVIAGEFNDAPMLHLLRGLGYRVEVVKVPRDLDEARAFILQFGELVGATDNARTLVADMDRRLAKLDAHIRREQEMSRQKAPLAAVYAPNGMTPGRNTVMTEILRRAGFRNLADELGIDGYGQLALERLLVADPDVLIYEATAEASTAAVSTGAVSTGAVSTAGSIAHTYLQHPALQQLARRIPSATLPPPLSECVGPMTVDAIERLVQVHDRWLQSVAAR